MSKVTIYSTPNCVFCRMAKSFFEEKGVDYVEKDVASDIPARQAMIEKTGQMGVPVIEVDGKIVIGFDKAKLIELLHL